MKRRLLTSSRTKSALPTHRLRQLFTLNELCGQVGCDYKLSDSFAAGNRLGYFAVVVQGNFNFAAIVAVDNTDFICRGKPLFCCKSAAGVDKPCIADGQLHCDTRGDKHGGMGRDSHFAVKAGVQICTGGILAAVGGYSCVCVEFLYRYLRFFHLDFSPCVYR